MIIALSSDEDNRISISDAEFHSNIRGIEDAFLSIPEDEKILSIA
jgi:hypothetical protein